MHLANLIANHDLLKFELSCFLLIIQDGSAAVVAGCCCCGCAVDVVVVDFVVMVVDGTGDDGTGTGNVGNGIDYIMIKSSAMAPATVVSLCVLLYVGLLAWLKQF